MVVLPSLLALLISETNPSLVVSPTWTLKSQTRAACHSRLPAWEMPLAMFSLMTFSRLMVKVSRLAIWLLLSPLFSPTLVVLILTSIWIAALQLMPTRQHHLLHLLPMICLTPQSNLRPLLHLSALALRRRSLHPSPLFRCHSRSLLALIKEALVSDSMSLRLHLPHSLLFRHLSGRSLRTTRMSTT